jgi:hypothetical protein
MKREDIPAAAIVAATILGCIAAAVSIASEDAASWLVAGAWVLGGVGLVSGFVFVVATVLGRWLR